MNSKWREENINKNSETQRMCCGGLPENWKLLQFPRFLGIREDREKGIRDGLPRY
jgi:hypothetical protein